METIIIKFAGNGKYSYHNKNAVDKVINYIWRKDARNPKGDNIYGSIGSFGKDKKEIIRDFYKIKELYHKTDGVQIKHIIVSFSKRPKMSRTKIHKLVKRTVGYWGKDYQVVYAVHEDTDDWHIHIGINSVSIYGKKISIRSKDERKFAKHLQRLWEGYVPAYYRITAKDIEKIFC